MSPSHITIYDSWGRSMNCPFCYQEKFKVGDKEICLHIEGAPATHGFSFHGAERCGGARGESLPEYLDKYFNMTLEDYHNLIVGIQ